MKPITLKENQEFIIATGVFVYTMNPDGKSFQITLVRKVADEPVKPKKQNKNLFIPPSIDEIKYFFKEKGYTESKAIQFYEYYSNGNPAWSDGKGRLIASWKQKAISVWFRPEDKIREENNGPDHMKGLVF